MHQFERSVVLWLPLFYLLSVAGFHFDGWFHAVVGRDEFWIPPHIIIFIAQLFHLLTAGFLVYRVKEALMNTAVKRYFFIQSIFFLGFAFDEAWHLVIGLETIDTPLVFWGPPHMIIAFCLLATPFFLQGILARIFTGTTRQMLTTLTFSTLLAFVTFYFQPLWPLGPFRVLGAYGEIVIMVLVAFVFFWGRLLLRFALSGVFLTLLALSLMEIMSWGSFADVPRIHELFGAPAYPYWLTFFSFLAGAIAVDALSLMGVTRLPVLGFAWAAVQSLLYYVGAMFWVAFSPGGVYRGWEYFPGVILSGREIPLLVLLAVAGGIMGAFIVQKVWQYQQQSSERALTRYASSSFPFGQLYLTLFLLFVLSMFLWLYFGNTVGLEKIDEHTFSLRTEAYILEPGREQYLVQEIIVPENTYLFSLQPEFLGASNILHHLVLSYEGRKDPFYFCPPMNQGLFSSGKELAGLSLPQPYGFYLQKGKKLLLEVHLANDTDMRVRGAVKLTMEGRPEGKSVIPVHLVSGVPFEGYCKKNADRVLSYEIPQGVRTHEARLEKPFVIGGTTKLIYWSGHIHDHGTSISLLKNGQVIDEFHPRNNPVATHNEGVYVGGRLLSPPVDFVPGDEISILTRYEKPAEISLKDAMGVGYLVFTVHE